MSIPAVLCCPEAKSSRDFLYSFLILSVSVTDSVGSTAEERNSSTAVQWECRAGNHRAAEGMWRRMGIAEGMVCPSAAPLTPSPGAFRAQTQNDQLQHLLRCSSGQMSGVQPSLISQLAEGDKQFKDVSHSSDTLDLKRFVQNG